MKEIIDSEFDPTQYNVVVIDFWADWCQPCKMLMPVFQKLANEFTTVTFAKANVDENPKLTTQYGISGIPALLFFKNGKIVTKLLGVQSEGKLRQTITEILNSSTT